MPSLVTIPGVKCMNPNEKEQKESRPPRWPGEGQTRGWSVPALPGPSSRSRVCSVRAANPSWWHVPGSLALWLRAGQWGAPSEQRTRGERPRCCFSVPSVPQPRVPATALCPTTALCSGTGSLAVPLPRSDTSLGHPRSDRQSPSPCPHLCHEPLH